MRQALDELLCRRYPALYADRHADPRTSAMGWGFDVVDGWFALIDALSDVLTRHATREQRPAPAVQQVKQKFGTLRYYVDGDAAERGAIALACEMSVRVCELSGQPGRLMRRGRQLMTRAPGAEPDLQPVAVGGAAGDHLWLPPLGFAAVDVSRWRADILAGPLDVPLGWLDLVDGMLKQLSPNVSAGSPTTSVRIDRVAATVHGLRVDHAHADPRTGSVIALATALARRIDPATGALGPVTDDGVLITADPR